MVPARDLLPPVISLTPDADGWDVHIVARFVAEAQRRSSLVLPANHLVRVLWRPPSEPDGKPQGQI